MGSGGDSDHQPIFFQMLNRGIQMISPFKFNAHWLENDELVNLLKGSWEAFNDNLHVIFLLILNVLRMFPYLGLLRKRRWSLKI